MQNTRKVTDDIIWVGCNDRRLARFENIFPLQNGVSYNSYLVMDEKITLFDTMDYLLNTVSNDTAVLLTADHETGGLKLGNDLFESNVLYSHGSHTRIDVPLFIHNFEIVKESDKSLQNIEIFNICRSLLKI